jgi:probable HAF family extracellular repeat protein
LGILRLSKVVEMLGNSTPKKTRLRPGHKWLEPLEARRLLTFYTVVDLGTLGGVSSYAYDINNSNQVVGYAKLASGADRAFLFKDANNNGVADSGEMVNLGTLAGFAASYAYAINNDGEIVGIAVTAANARKAVRFQAAGAPTDLGMGTGSSAYDVNIAGEIVGAITTGGPKYVAAYRSPDGQVTQLGTLSSNGSARSEAFAINDNGTIAGYSNTDAGDSAFIRPADGSMTAIGFPNQPVFYEYGYAWGINGAGQIVGEGFNSDAQYHAFRYENGAVTDLSTPVDFTTSQALAINNFGEIVGQGKNSAGNGRAIIYSDGDIYDLNALIPSSSGWTLTKARSINDNGYIVGEGISPTGQTHAFLLAPAGNVLTISGDQDTPDQDDTILLRRSSTDPSSVEVFLNNNTSTPSSTFIVAEYLHLFVNGGGGNDHIILDFSGGVPFPAGGASVDGQGGDLDSLQVIGTSSADNLTITPGRISLSAAAASFNGIEAIDLDTGAGDDAVNLNAALPFMPLVSGGDGNDSITISSGVYTLSSDAGAGSVEAINLQNSAILNLAASQHLSELSIGGTARVNLQADGAHFIYVNDLTVNTAASLDLVDNALIIDTSDVDGALTMVNGLLRSARNSQTRWAGSGISSSAAASNSITGLGAVINNDGAGAPIRTSLYGETLNTNMVLVVYTYEGDLDVNGTINADDYSLIDSGYAQNLSGYHWGDINYSGDAPNSDDYFLIDRAYSGQGPSSSNQLMPSLSEEIDRASKHLRAKLFAKKPMRLRSGSGHVALAVWNDIRDNSLPVSSRFWVAWQRSWRKPFRSESLTGLEN